MSASGSAPRYSILITSFRSLRFLEECLGSLMHLEGPDYEVLFLDNGSPEPEAEWAKAHITDPRFRVFQVPETRYFAGGVNYLAERANGEFLILLNSDAKADPAWLTTLDAYLRATGYEACGSEVRETHAPDVPRDARWRLDVFGLIHPVPKRPGPLFAAGGCGMAIKRSVFEELGALDEDFKMYFEEIDLCWHLDLQGYRVGHVDGAIIHHVGQGSSSKTFFLWNRFRGRRNRIWSYFKNAGPLLLVVFVPGHLLICVVSIVFNLLTGRFRNAIAEIAAIAAAFYNLRIPLSKRGAIQKSRQIGDGELIAKGLMTAGALNFLFRNRKPVA